jgi:hypothetical protein
MFPLGQPQVCVCALLGPGGYPALGTAAVAAVSCAVTAKVLAVSVACSFKAGITKASC